MWLQVFKDYVSAYDPKDSKIALKIIHTYKVADIAQSIAKSLNLSEEDQDTAYLIGLFHDIGRFEQVRIYHTFNDAKSCNHAKLSVQVLEKEGFLESLDHQRQELILKAILNHNRFELEKNLDERQQLFANIIRDADKIDILRVFAMDDPIDTTQYLPEEVYDSDISEKVARALKQRSCILKKDRKTPLDVWLTFPAFFYDFNFPVSLCTAYEQGYYKERFDLNKFQRENVKKQLQELFYDIDQMYLKIKDS